MVGHRLGRAHLLAALVAAPLLLGAASPARLEQAVIAQRAVLAANPGDAGALNDLGNLLVELDELEAAEASYREALAADPARPEPQYNLALLLHATGRRRQAVQQLRNLLRDHPEHAWGHYHLGTLQLVAGNRGRALKRYREAFRLDPALAAARNNPHVIDNPLAIPAMLGAFRRLARASTSPRLYADPTRITGLLLPPLAAAEAEPEPPAVEVKPPIDAEVPPPIDAEVPPAAPEG